MRSVSALCLAAAMMCTASMAHGVDHLRLRDGDRLTGTVVRQTNDAVVFDHNVLGRMTVPLDEIVIDDQDAQRRQLYRDVALAAMQDAADADVVPVEKEWVSYFEFGGAAAFGNSDTQNFNLAFETVRKTETTRTTIDASYYYDASDGDRSDSKFTAGILNDWFFKDSDWLFFATARYDYDEFNSWTQRVQAFAGPGYELIKRDNYDLTLRAGLGATREFNSNDDDVRLDALFGVDVNWKITERQRFHFDSTIFPQLTDLGEFRTLTNAKWSVLVDEESNLSLSIGVQHEYQSIVAPGDEEHDIRITANLRIDF